MPPVDVIRDFVLQVEKTLAARRLYQPGSSPYRDACDRLYEKCRAAAGSEGFTLLFGSTDLFVDKTSVINRPKRDDSFFFPLYRDGLRELTFSPEVSATDLDALVSVFETKDRALGAADDMVNHLWRCDLSTITHNAIDGIGEIEDDGSGDGKDDFRALVADLAEKIRNPAAAETGQRYAFLLDADVQVAAQDFHYDRTTVRRTFEENPTVLQLTAEQAEGLRAEMGDQRDDALLERFIEILLVLLRSPIKTVERASVARVLEQLADGYWNARDFHRMTVLLTHIRAVGRDAAVPESRFAAVDALTRFFADERIAALLSEFEKGTVPLPIAERTWELIGLASAFPHLIDLIGRLPHGENRSAVMAHLRKQASSNTEIFAAALSSPESSRVRATLALMDENLERTYATQLMALASHADESIRLKGLHAASRFGGHEALEVLWKAMESDPSKSVRLFAFRAIASLRLPAIVPRLQALVTSAQFVERPVWEREKYVRLLGTIAGAAAEPLFESWIPSKRWFWQEKDLHTLELALRGLGACGESGFEKVLAFAGGSGKPAEIARKVADSISRCEIGENTVMKPAPPVAMAAGSEKR